MSVVHCHGFLAGVGTCLARRFRVNPCVDRFAIFERICHIWFAPIFDQLRFGFSNPRLHKSIVADTSTQTNCADKDDC